MKKFKLTALIFGTVLAVASFAIAPPAKATKMPEGTFIKSLTVSPNGPYTKDQSVTFTATMTSIVTIDHCYFGFSQGADPKYVPVNGTVTVTMNILLDTMYYLNCSPDQDGTDWETRMWTAAARPTNPGNLSAVYNDDSGDINVNWTASADTSGIKRYYICWGGNVDDGLRCDETQNTTFTIKKSDYNSSNPFLNIVVQATNNNLIASDDVIVAVDIPKSNSPSAPGTSGGDNEPDAPTIPNASTGTNTNKPPGASDSGLALFYKNPLVVIIVGLLAAGTVFAVLRRHAVRR